MGTKHRHAEVIKAWADGEDIEMYIRSVDRWCEAQTPMWDTTTQYRVKPKNIVVKRVVKYDPVYDRVGTYNTPTKWDVSYTFTPEGNLVSVEMIK